MGLGGKSPRTKQVAVTTAGFQHNYMGEDAELCAYCALIVRLLCVYCPCIVRK